MGEMIQALKDKLKASEALGFGSTQKALRVAIEIPPLSLNRHKHLTIKIIIINNRELKSREVVTLYF